MNHTNLSRLLVFLGDNPNELTYEQVSEYLWLVEQLLQELRQRALYFKHHLAQELPPRA